MELDIQSILLLLLATGLGTLIGLERSIGKTENPSDDVRTFSLVGFLGAFTTFISLNFNSTIFMVLGFGFLSILIGILYYFGLSKFNRSGITTELSIIITFLLGIFVMIGFYKIAIILSIVVTFLLSSKPFFEKFSQKISLVEVQNTIKFAVIALVILPLLPDEKYSILNILQFIGFEGTFSNQILNLEFFNPYGIWFFVVLMSGISYAGYIMSKFVGEKSSIIASGAIGGLVSSTAVTASMTENSKKDEKHTDLYVVSTLIASTIMFIRVVVIVLLFNINMISSILLPSILMLLGMIIYMLIFYFKGRKNKNEENLVESKKDYKSPFSVGPALKFALFVLFIKFVSGVGSLYKDFWGDYFYYALGVISGLADVDAISQTMAVDSKDGKIALTVAATTIIIAIISNNFVKGGLALSGNKKFGLSVMMGFVVSMIMGIFGILLVYIF